MRLRFSAVVAAVVAVMPLGTALGQVQTYELNFTSSGTARLAGGFSWSGQLPANGTYDFASGGSPIVAASFTLNAVPNTSTLSGSLAMPGLVPSLTGTFQMTTATPGTGTANFQSDGTPMANPSFTFDGSTFTNLPNQNDSYRLAGGDVTRLKYDLAAAGKTLALALDGSYVVQAGATILESGTYAMAPAGSDVYTLTGNNASATARFTNLPKMTTKLSATSSPG